MTRRVDSLTVAEQRAGFLFGCLAYLLWGLFPLYWSLLDDSGRIEILAHRIVWSLVTIAVLVAIRHRLRQLLALWADPVRRWWLVFAAVLITVNWGVFIWGVANNAVVEISLGYFMTPLFTVMLGVLVLSERLRVAQWVALGIAALAVLGIAIEYGRPPWVALALTVSFGAYGLAKNRARAGAIDGLAIETAVLAPVAMVVLIALAMRGEHTVVEHGPVYLVVALLSGPVTALPLLLFGAAATRISLTLLGVLQYIAPLIQFALGVLVYREAMPAVRWVGFALVWLALIVLTWDGIAHRRRTLALARAVPV